jgi:hypothetical protein
MDLPKVEPELRRQTCLMSCDGNQNVRVKDEELPDVKVENIAESKTLPVVKYENEVSFVFVSVYACVCVCARISQKCGVSCCLSCIHLPVHMRQAQYFEVFCSKCLKMVLFCCALLVM